MTDLLRKTHLTDIFLSLSVTIRKYHIIQHILYFAITRFLNGTAFSEKAFIFTGNSKHNKADYNYENKKNGILCYDVIVNKEPLKCDIKK